MILTFLNLIYLNLLPDEKINIEITAGAAEVKRTKDFVSAAIKMKKRNFTSFNNDEINLLDISGALNY